MTRSMKERQEALKTSLSYVHVNDHQQRLWATITDDFGGCLLKDLAKEDFKALKRNAHSDVNVCVSYGLYKMATVVTGRFREEVAFADRSLGAGILYTLHGVAMSRAAIDELKVRSVRVFTPVVGRSSLGLVAVGGSFFDAMHRLQKGNEVTLRLSRHDMEYDGWANTIPWTASQGIRQDGIVFDDRMCTTIPMQDAKGHPAIVESIKKVLAYRTLLIVLNGGYPVDLSSIELDVGDEQNPILISFYSTAPDLLRYGFNGDGGPYTNHHNMLRSWSSLEEVGMEGVAKWDAWWFAPSNEPTISHWLRPDDEASPMATLEGLARAAGWRPGKSYGYHKTLIVAMDKMGLGDLFDSARSNGIDKTKVAMALAEAHNHNKHIGNWYGDDYHVVSSFAARAEVFISFVVAYGVLVAAGIVKDIDDDPNGLRGKWVQVIRECYRAFIEPKIAELPEAIWKRAAPRQTAELDKERKLLASRALRESAKILTHEEDQAQVAEADDLAADATAALKGDEAAIARLTDRYRKDGPARK